MSSFAISLVSTPSTTMRFFSDFSISTVCFRITNASSFSIAGHRILLSILTISIGSVIR